MKLNILYDKDEVLAASVVSCGYTNFFYDFDDSIRTVMANNLELLKKEILEDWDIVESTSVDEIDSDEKNFLLAELNKVLDNLNGDIDKFINCFDQMQIEVANIEVLENIDKVIDGINIPVVLNLCQIDEDYLLENLGRIDSDLKNKFNNKISYIINQCLDEAEAHYEDNSYDLDDVMLVLTTIKDLTTTIRKFDLSPLEQIMYAYDIVKDREYIASSRKDSYLESRDVAKILKSDKIVCLGFASLFKSLLDNLGFTNEILFLDGIKDPTNGHARNLVSVNDPKYNLNHILYFDATWDSKKLNEIQNDENRYEYFAREHLYFLLKDNKVLKEHKYLSYYLRKNNDYSFLYEETPSKLVQIKRIFRMIDWEEYIINSDIPSNYLDKFLYLMSDDYRAACFLSQDMDFCEYIYKECSIMLNRKLDNEDFFKCLYTVRRVENSFKPDKYSIEFEDLTDGYYRRLKPNMSNEEKFLFGQMMGMDSLLEERLNKFDEIDKVNSREKLLIRLKNLNDNIKLLEVDYKVSVKEVIKILKK